MHPTLYTHTELAELSTSVSSFANDCNLDGGDRKYLNDLCFALRFVVQNTKPQEPMQFIWPIPYNELVGKEWEAWCRKRTAESTFSNAPSLPRHLQKWSAHPLTDFHCSMLLELLDGRSDVYEAVHLLKQSLVMFSKGCKAVLVQFHLRRLQQMLPETESSDVLDAIALLSECIIYLDKCRTATP